MTALICGSLAFDTIMVFPGHFKNEILPDKVHMLNVSFTVPEMRKEFGGCAGNIAYSLKLLGGQGTPMGTVGRDFQPYANWLEQHGIDTRFVRVIEDTYTAQAYITTDLDDNQITAFHPGAMGLSHTQAVSDEDGFTLGAVSPDGRDGMLEHARQFADKGVPFLFDPGQGMPLFNGEELREFIEAANWVAVNEYEAEMLSKRTGWSLEQMRERVEALIVTRGAEGSSIYTETQRLDVPSATPSALADPTGCGDAYRAGLLYGLMRGMDWETTGRIASLLGAIKIERPGTQNHHFTPDSFRARFKKEFGHVLD